jgi:hypothetical protein
MWTRLLSAAGRAASSQRLQGAIIGAVVSALLVGGTALATTHSPSASSLIKACVNSKTRVLTVPRHGHACPAHNVAINWNKAGPVGPQGETGNAGPAGPVIQVAGSVSADCTQIYPNPNYSVIKLPGSQTTCELDFPFTTPHGDPLLIITPIGQGVSVTSETSPVCTGSIPGSCGEQYTLSAPGQVVFVADVLGGHF